MTIAEQRGVASVTVRAVAEEAGVSLGVVHYCFESKEELLAAMGESLVQQLSESMRQAFGEVKHAPDLRGLAGLQELLHIGLSQMLPTIVGTPDRQLLTYEITAQALRHRASAGEHSADIAGQQYRKMDNEAIEFLSACAEIAEVRWKTPVEEIARLGLALVDGVVLRWLVDRDREGMIAAFDETVRVIAAKAVELP